MTFCETGLIRLERFITVSIHDQRASKTDWSHRRNKEKQLSPAEFSDDGKPYFSLELFTRSLQRFIVGLSRCMMAWKQQQKWQQKWWGDGDNIHNAKSNGEGNIAIPVAIVTPLPSPILSSSLSLSCSLCCYHINHSVNTRWVEWCGVYWASCSSIRSFARSAHSFAFFALLSRAKVYRQVHNYFINSMFDTKMI